MKPSQPESRRASPKASPAVPLCSAEGPAATARAWLSSNGHDGAGRPGDHGDLGAARGAHRARSWWRRLHDGWRHGFRPWLTGRWLTQLRRRVQAVARYESALQQHGQAVEQAFVGIGAALHEQTRLAARLVEQGRRFNSYTAATAEANPVRGAAKLIEDSLAKLEAFRQQTTELTEQLRAQHEEIARLRHNGSQLERAVAPLRIVDTLFRIEAASLPSEMQAAFGALTQEIGQLDMQVRETFSRHFEGLGATSGVIAGVVEHLAVQLAEQDRVATTQRAAMRQSLAALDGEILQMRRRDERLAALLAEIDRDANAIVVSLQYQDITRQKLEHVLVAIKTLGKRTADSSSPDMIAYAQHAGRLEACQLAAIEENLREASSRIDRGLQGIVGRLHAVETDYLSGADCAAATAKAGATFDTLFAMLAEVRAPLDEAAANAAAAMCAVRSFGGITADMGDTVRALTWGIRLIALNAQVQAAQVRRCDGLEVLARHTYAVSEETSRLADTLGRDLGSLTGRLRELVTRAEAFATATGETGREFQSSADGLIAALRRQRESVVDALQQFSPLLRQTREHASRLRQGAALAHVDCGPLKTVERELHELGDWCDRRSVAADGAAVQAELTTLQRKYTMAAERAVHAAVVAGVDGAVASADKSRSGIAASAPRVDVRCAADALGDNVELF